MTKPSESDSPATPMNDAARLAAIHLLSHPSLDRILVELTTNPAAIAEVTADPRGYLAGKGIEIPAEVELSFHPEDPSAGDVETNCRIRILGICLF